MAWNKDVKFLVKTDTAWKAQNPVIPSGAIIGITVGGDIRLKIGTGETYNNTKYINELELAKKHTKGSSATKVVFEDGHTAEIETLTIQDLIEAGYHLVTDEEWEYLKLQSIAPPSFTANAPFSNGLIKEIGETISGNYTFTLSKQNTSNFKETTGGNIAVSQGGWSGDGDFDIISANSITINAGSFTLTSAGTVVFTLFGRDIYDQVVSTQKFTIEYQYPIWGGTKADQTLVSQAGLSNLVKKVAASAEDLEFYLDPGGSSHYFHLLIPKDLDSNLDIRDMSSPGPGSGNMSFVQELNLTVNGQSNIKYNHYVTDFQSAGEVDFVIKKVE